MIVPRTARVALLVVAGASLACESVPVAPETPTPIGTLRIDVDSATLAVGEWIYPAIEVRDTSGAPVDRIRVEWTSSSPASVSVDSVGTITALAPGSAVVTASAPPLTHQVRIRVPHIFAIRLMPEVDTLLAGERVQPRPVVESDIPFAPSAHRFTWTSSNRSVARVDSIGIVTTRAAGPGLTVSAAIGGVTGSMRLDVEYTDTPFMDIVATSSGVCVLRQEGIPYCWGLRTEIGLGAAPPRQDGIERVPVPHDPDGPRFSAVDASASTMCGVSEGDVWCWGWDGAGTGPAVQAGVWYPVPTRFVAGLDLERVAVGYAHTCALDAAGVAWCWGSNNNGQLGDGTFVSRAEPAPVAGATRFRVIRASGRATCGVAMDGALLCWGSNAARGIQAGVEPCANFGGGGCVLVPTAVPGLPPVADVAVAVSELAWDQYMCAIAVHGGLHCWGDRFGAPRALDDIRYVSISSGLEHACALADDGRAFCVGSNRQGRMGNPAIMTEFALEPTPVFGDLRFAAIATGARHTCGLTQDGLLVFCWGANESGQLGQGEAEGTPIPRETPIP